MQYHDRPILKAEVVGIIVNVILSSKRQTYYVDDGTGVIRCVKFLSDNGNYNKSTITSSGDIKSKVDNIDATEISVGDLVSVRGMLAYSETNTDDYGIFIHIIRIETIEDSNYESYYKLKCLVLEKEVYTKH